MTPLEGTRILDLSRYAPGPYCTLVCAALGAAVVKVEAPPHGDPLRELDPVAFERLNAGKKSVLLDLKSDDGMTRLWKLVRSAHVLVESFRPGVMERLGAGFEQVNNKVPARASESGSRARRRSSGSDGCVPCRGRRFRGPRRTPGVARVPWVDAQSVQQVDR